MKQTTLEEKFDKLFVADDRLMHDKYARDDILSFIHSEIDQAVKSQLQSIIKSNTDPQLGTVDYDGVAKDVIRLVEELK